MMTCEAWLYDPIGEPPKYVLTVQPDVITTGKLFTPPENMAELLAKRVDGKAHDNHVVRPQEWSMFQMIGKPSDGKIIGKFIKK